MEPVPDSLQKIECCNNWGLSELQIDHEDEVSRAEHFKKKLDVRESMETGDENHDRPLRLVYAFELFKTDPGKAMSIVDEISQEVLLSKDVFTKTYEVPFLHVIYGTKAHMLWRSNPKEMSEVEKVVGLIKPKGDMSEEEMSGLLAMKARVFSMYGPEGTSESVPLLREAVRKNPDEVEWSLSLIASMNRIRNFNRGMDVPWSQVEEPVDILEKLLNHPKITPKQTTTCKYYLAVVYNDYTMGKYVSDDIRTCQRQILQLCRDIHSQTDHPQTLAFCAQQLNRSYGDPTKAMEIIEQGLKKFPKHVGINTTACKMFQNRRNFVLAAEHAQTAMDNGGYGAAWLLLQCKAKLNDVFDDNDFFDRLIKTYPEAYKKQTYAHASMYYFFHKRNAVQGARFMELAIDEDPEFNGIHHWNHSHWAGGKVRPIEVAYNQIHRGLQEDENQPTLLSAKSKIEKVADVSAFDLTADLVMKNLTAASKKRKYAYKETELDKSDLRRKLRNKWHR